MKATSLSRALLCLGLLFTNSLIADSENLEYKIKAGYLYNFTKFITWPNINGATFNLCLLGNDPFGSVIDPIEKKSAFAKTIKVVRIDESDFLNNPNQKPDCHILYINGANKPQMVFEKIHANPNRPGMLIVGEGENFVTEGGMIGFVNRDGKIRLQINLQSVKLTDLKISAKLLEVAELVRDESHD